MEALKYFINGKAEQAKTKEFTAVTESATGRVLYNAPLANYEDVDLAVASAKAAFPSWAATTPQKRARIMTNFRLLLENNTPMLAELICQEHGKVFEDASGSIARGIEVVEFATAIPTLLKGSHSLNVGTGVDCYDNRFPLGVCAGIVPFNFPMMVPLWMAPVAIACGNTFVLKASPEVPSAALKVAELAIEAGMPPGVFNVIIGDSVAATAMMEHNDVKAISFVGSTKVAKIVYETSAKNGKRVQALAGAKNHLLAMPDTNIDGVANALMGAAYGSAGERCMAISVLVTIDDKQADAIIAAIKEKVAKLKIGNGLDKTSEMGPVIHEAHLNKIKSYIDIGVKEGAKLAIDGRNIKVAGYEQGYFIGPCLFDNVKSEMRIYKEEIFGPVLCVVRCKSFDEALDLINKHEYGNGASIFTDSGYYSNRFSKEVEAGMVGVNIPIPVPVAYHSFGGWKSSLFGSSHIHGQEGVNFYTKLKTITTRYPQINTADKAEFAMPVHNKK